MAGPLAEAITNPADIGATCWRLSPEASRMRWGSGSFVRARHGRRPAGRAPTGCRAEDSAERTRCGHGQDGLLHAAADAPLAGDGFHTLYTWALEADTAMRRFLESSGWAVDGGRAELDVGLSARSCACTRPWRPPGALGCVRGSSSGIARGHGPGRCPRRAGADRLGVAFGYGRLLGVAGAARAGGRAGAAGRRRLRERLQRRRAQVERRGRPGPAGRRAARTAATGAGRGVRLFLRGRCRRARAGRRDVLVRLVAVGAACIAAAWFYAARTAALRV